MSFFSPQVKPSAVNLNTNDAFVLKTPDTVFLWRGVGATDEELAAAKHVCTFLGGSVTEVAEGKEPGEHLLNIPFKTNSLIIIIF